MSKDKPAFPLDRDWSHMGLTKREWFAGQILTGWFSGKHVNPYGMSDAYRPDQIARMVYRMADAMIAAGGGNE